MPPPLKYSEEAPTSSPPDRLRVPRLAPLDNPDGAHRAVVGDIQPPCLSVPERDPVADRIAFRNGRAVDALLPFTGQELAAPGTLGRYDWRAGRKERAPRHRAQQG